MTDQLDAAAVRSMLAQVQRHPTPAVRQDLLNLLVSLPHWFVVDLGSRTKVLPLVREDDGGQTVHIFLSNQSANRVLGETETCPESVSVVSLSGCERASFMSTLQRWGVRSVTVEPGPVGVSWTIDEFVIALWSAQTASQVYLDVPNSDLSGGGSEPSGKIWDSMCTLPFWYFIADPVSTADPMIGICRDQPGARAYTDPIRARKAAMALDPATQEEGNRLMAISPQAAAGWLRSLARRGVAGMVFNNESHGFFVPIDRLRLPGAPIRHVA